MRVSPWKHAALAAVGVTSLTAVPAGAAIIRYELQNHPDGAEATPFYGLRLDELFDATPAHDVFSFDFDALGSAMFLERDTVANTIRIFGTSLGGRDVGNAYANDQYLGIYTIDMLYAAGVSQVPGDDDYWVTSPTNSNWGSVQVPGPSNIVIPLANMDMGGFSFRLGDEDNDMGHRGAAGLSGWGWVNHGVDPNQHVPSSDWLFTATEVIPTPGSAALAMLGAGLISRSRKRR